MFFSFVALSASIGLALATPANQMQRRVLNGMPSGADTSNVARSKIGSVPYGPTMIYNCVNNGDVALTFDDGPYWYTNSLLDLLEQQNVKATFFINGDNYGRGYINAVDDWRNVITRMYNSGHQVASHTWDHASLDSLDANGVRAEMIWNEIAIADIIGKFPTYMRYANLLHGKYFSNKD